MRIQRASVAGPVVIQIDIRALTCPFRQLPYMFRIIEVIPNRYRIDIYHCRTSSLIELFYPALLLSRFRRSPLGDSLPGCLRHTYGHIDDLGLNPAAPALESSQQSPDSALSCSYPRLEVRTEAGRLVLATCRGARNLRRRKLTVRIVLLSPIFDPVLIFHTSSIMSPVRNCKLR